MVRKKLKRYVRSNQSSHWLSSWLQPCLAKCGSNKTTLQMNTLLKSPHRKIDTH